MRGSDNSGGGVHHSSARVVVGLEETSEVLFTCLGEESACVSSRQLFSPAEGTETALSPSGSRRPETLRFARIRFPPAARPVLLEEICQPLFERVVGSSGAAFGIDRPASSLSRVPAAPLLGQQRQPEIRCSGSATIPPAGSGDLLASVESWRLRIYSCCSPTSPSSLIALGNGKPEERRASAAICLDPLNLQAVQL